MKTNSTLDYYNKNAQLYVDNTFNAKIQKDYDKFLASLPEKSRILDVGAGSGRDSLYFKKLGYDVVAVDPSVGLAEKASEIIGQEVIVVKAEDMKFDKEFDGIWAMSSLLHLNDEQLEKAIQKCHMALKDGGKMFASFRNAEDELVDPKGRYFNSFNTEKVKALFDKLFDNIRIETQSDSLDRAGVTWISAYANKKPVLELVKTVNKTKKLKVG